MKNLNKLLREKPTTRKVDLTFNQLEEIDSLMSELYRFKQLEELNLSSNRLEKLPEDMSILKNLKKLDITNNLFPNNKEVLKSLRTLESLQVLMITCTANEENAIIKELPKLNILNKNVLRKMAVGESGGTAVADQIKNQIEMNKAEKENRLKTLRKRLKFLPEDVEESQRIVSLIQKTSENLRREEEFKSVDPNFQQVAERVREQQKKLDTQNLPAYEQSVQVINMRYELVENLFKPIGQLASFYSEELASAVRNAFSSVTKVHELSQTYLNAAIEMGSSAGPDLANKGKGGGSLLADSMNMEKEVWMLRKREMEKEIMALREENKKCYDMIVKLAKDEVDGQTMIKTISSKTQTKTDLKFAKKDEEGTKVSVQEPKVLTLHQLQELIREIFRTKKEFDVKNMNAGIPRETMEQYLYTYLTNKYGLKNLVVSWASTIIAMIGTHSKHDNMVLLFGKMLRNEIEESFFYDQMKNSTQIATSLKRYLMEKHPLKPNADIKKLHKEIMEGLISRQQANDLINVIFFGKDAKAVELLCDHLFAESLHEITAGRESKLKVTFKSLEKIILDYMLSAHEDRLANFRELYTGLDVDKHGWLVGDDIIKLLEQLRMRKCMFDVAAAKKKVDPKNMKKVTFSTFVEILEDINSEGTSLSLIQKLALA